MPNKTKTEVKTKFESIDHAAAQLIAFKRDYLRLHGWTETCNTPGAYWLWRRDFSIEDKAAHENWLARGPGPMGWPSEPKPWGIITAPLDLAVDMTRATLDVEETSEDEVLEDED